MLLFLNSCQNSASSNKIISECPQNASLKYPLKTGQRDIFTYQDINTTPPSFYEDDGFYQRGYPREFNNLGDGTVYNANYGLYWQDNNVTLENNATVAKGECNSLVLAGKSNWRLPNVYELATLLNLDSRTYLRESVFNNMPVGSYYTSNEVIGTDETIVVGYGKADFNITKVKKFNDTNLSNVANSKYGVKVGISQIPKYTSKGVLLYITDAIIYYDSATLLQTTISTVKRFDVNGTLTTTDGPFVVQKALLHPLKVKAKPKIYVKCVSGKEIKGFSFKRDNKNGVVVDSATNLMWEDDKYVVQNNHQWGDSIKYCANLELDGYKDWRLPTITELITINDFSSNGTFTVNNAFIYRSAGKFHSSSNGCHGVDCYQKNYQLNASGYFDEKVGQNRQVDTNPYDNNTSEPYYKTRCVRCGF